ncbi:NAD-dependent epimerase/dehydratase family protein [Prochlorococcus marinus]
MQADKTFTNAKRLAEALCFDYERMHNVDIRIMRIFNTYGPRMLPNDGRVISNFVVQALQEKSLTVYGEGKQTRSFCFFDDLIKGMNLLMNSSHKRPIKLGNPDEYSILSIAEIIRSKINPKLKIIHQPLPSDDPNRRKPNINLAREKLDWQSKIDFSEGLDKTIAYF